MADPVRATRIEIPAPDQQHAREVAIDCLNEYLANTIYAQLAAKFAHWNVKGTGFHPAHLLFDQVYDFYEESVDKIGERITALGGTAEGLLHDVMMTCDVSYDAGPDDKVEQHMKAMADLLGRVVNGYREGIETVRVEDVNDQTTQDLFIELCREGDKLLYFLEAELRV